MPLEMPHEQPELLNDDDVRQMPPRLAEPAVDPRFLSDRELDRAYRSYALAYIKLQSVYDPSSYHAQLSEIEKQDLFDVRLVKLQALEEDYHAKEKRRAMNAARRAKGRSSQRPQERAQRYLFVDAFPDEFQFIGSRYPFFPFVSDNPKQEGSARRALHESLSWRYVQYNPSSYAHLLIIDYDGRPGIDVGEVWKHAGLPKPTYIVRTPSSLKGHLVWAIKTPIPTLDIAKSKGLNYFRAIEVAYTKAAGGDFGFNGFLTKNPVHPFGAWEVEWLNPHPYTLKELASFVELPKNAKQAKRDARMLALSEHEKVGYGRNCAMFYTVAEWSYTAIRPFWGRSYDIWANAVREQCDILNGSFPVPLEANEVKHISNSIARWTWANTTAKGFSEVQSHRGAKGGKKSGVTRLAKAQVYAEEVRTLRESGMTQQAIAEKLNIARSTVVNLLKREVS